MDMSTCRVEFVLAGLLWLCMNHLKLDFESLRRCLSEAYRHVHPKKRFPDEEVEKKQMVRVLQEAGRSEEDFNPNFEK